MKQTIFNNYDILGIKKRKVNRLVEDYTLQNKEEKFKEKLEQSYMRRKCFLLKR